MRIKREVAKNIYRYAYMLLGLFICSVAYNALMVPNEFAAGNATGLALIINALFKYNIALSVAVINISLLFVSWIFLGKKATIGSVVGSLVMPVFVAITEPLVHAINFSGSSLLLAALFAGILDGLGNGMVFKVGFTTGGTDIINQIVERYGKISLGLAIILTDGMIALSSAFVFGIKEAIYSFSILWLTSVMTDKVVLGISSSKAVYIITSKEEEVKNYIFRNLKRSVSVFEGTGAFTEAKQNVLLCVIPSSRYHRLTDGIKKIDKRAFFSVTDSYQVVGGDKYV